MRSVPPANIRASPFFQLEETRFRAGFLARSIRSPSKEILLIKGHEHIVCFLLGHKYGETALSCQGERLPTLKSLYYIFGPTGVVTGANSHRLDVFCEQTHALNMGYA